MEQLLEGDKRVNKALLWKTTQHVSILIKDSIDRGRLIMWEREEGMARMMFLSSLKRMGFNPQVHSWPLSGHGKLILSCNRKGSTDVHRFRWVGMGNKVF